MFSWRTITAAAALAALAAPALGDPGAPSPDPAAAPAPAPAPQAAPAAATAPATWKDAFLATGGYGYYERLHAGVAYQLGSASSIGAFLGSNLGVGDSTTWTVGLDFRHALWEAPRQVELGLATKALYWTQSNPDYDWKVMTLGLGAYAARELRPSLALALDAGVALSFDVGVNRKQNVNFEYPTRWNGSVCLELRYRFD